MNSTTYTIQAEGKKRLLVWGHSMGGAIACQVKNIAVGFLNRNSESQTILLVRNIAISFFHKYRIPNSTADALLAGTNKMETAALGFGAWLNFWQIGHCRAQVWPCFFFCERSWVSLVWIGLVLVLMRYHYICRSFYFYYIRLLESKGNSLQKLISPIMPVSLLLQFSDLVFASDSVIGRITCHGFDLMPSSCVIVREDRFINLTVTCRRRQVLCHSIFIYWRPWILLKLMMWCWSGLFRWSWQQTYTRQLLTLARQISSCRWNISFNHIRYQASWRCDVDSISVRLFTNSIRPQLL